MSKTKKGRNQIGFSYYLHYTENDPRLQAPGVLLVEATDLTFGPIGEAAMLVAALLAEISNTFSPACRILSSLRGWE